MVTSEHPIWENDSQSLIVRQSWRPRRGTYLCHVMAFREEDGQSYSAVVLNLPGAVSYGKTMAEAFQNIRESAAALIESYRAEGKDIPWRESCLDDVVSDAQLKWILVDA